MREGGKEKEQRRNKKEGGRIGGGKRPKKTQGDGRRQRNERNRWLGLALQMEALKSTDLFSNSYDIHQL